MKLPRTLLKRLLRVLIIGYLGAALVLYLFQRDLLYHPTPATSTYSPLTVASGQERINVTVANPGRSQAVIYFGGNSERVVDTAGRLASALPQTTTYLVDYRGYGNSTGSPTEAGLFADALAVFDAIAVKHQTIHAIGRSLGTGVALYLAAQRPVHRLVLVTPYDSILSVAQGRYPIFPVELLLKDRFESVRYAPDIGADSLFLAAARDRIVPPQHTRRLLQAMDPARTSVHWFARADHNSIALEPAYFPMMQDFLEKP